MYGRRVNVRNQPSTTAAVIGQVVGGAVVDILEGPSEIGGYRWWRISDRFGLEGWVAEGDGEEVWLVPLPTATPTPEGTYIGVGDTVVVNTRDINWLALRSGPSPEAELLRRYPPGSRLTVVGGPVVRAGYVWWQVRDQRGRVGWMAEGDESERWLIPER